MPPDLTFHFIRKADAATLNCIITLYRTQGWWSRSDKPELLPRIINGSHCFVLAEREGRIIGMGRAISDGVSDAYIQDVAVKKEYRGLGLGSKIVRGLKSRLKADGIKWVGLIAQNDSHAFYESLGFKVVKRAQPMILKANHV